VFEDIHSSLTTVTELTEDGSEMEVDGAVTDSTSTSTSTLTPAKVSLLYTDSIYLS